MNVGILCRIAGEIRCRSGLPPREDGQMAGGEVPFNLGHLGTEERKAGIILAWRYRVAEQQQVSILRPRGFRRREHGQRWGRKQGLRQSSR